MDASNDLEASPIKGVQLSGNDVTGRLPRGEPMHVIRYLLDYLVSPLIDVILDFSPATSY